MTERTAPTRRPAHPLMTEAEVAALMRVSLRTVQRWRRVGATPAPLRRPDRRILYVRAEVLAWANARSDQ